MSTPSHTAPERASTAAASARPPLRVLHVEDDPISAALFARLLAREPRLAVRTAVTAAAAMTLAADWQPEVLVIDSQLPDGDGYSLLGKLRSLPELADVPACMCAADDRPAAAQRALALGFDAYWSKPVPGDVVLTALLEIADRPR